MRASAAKPSLAALVLVTGIGPLATDAYLPGLPGLQQSLDTSAATAQLTLTAFIVGLALGQLVIGPVSDGSGRRSVLLASAFAFLVLSALCAVVASAPLLVLLRLLEGFAAGGGVAAGRAVVSDTSHGDEAARRYGTLASATLLGPVLAPPVGSVILSTGSWRTVFVVLAATGFAMVALIWTLLPESLPRERRQPNSAFATARRVGDLVTDHEYMRHVVVQCFGTMGFFVYIGGSSFALQTIYGISESRYAAVFTVNAITMVLTSVLFRALVVRVGAPRLRALGLGTAMAGAAGLLVVALLGTGRVPHLAVPWALFACVTGGMGLMIPASQILAQEAGRRSAGTAAALVGGLVFLAGSLVIPLTGVLGYTTLLPMALLMCGFLGLSVLVLAVRRPVL